MEEIVIGIMGGAGQHRDQNYELGILKAYEIGRFLGKKRILVVTGTAVGLPYAAALGARDARGETIGISPAKNIEEHVIEYNKPLEDTYIYLTGRGLIGREIENIALSTGIIAIGGGAGTFTEIGIAAQAGKPIGGLLGIGGFSDKILENEELLAKYGSIIVYHSRPEELVDQMIEASKRYLENPQGLAKKGHPWLFGRTREEIKKQIIPVDRTLEGLIEQSKESVKDVKEILKKIRNNSN